MKTVSPLADSGHLHTGRELFVGGGIAQIRLVRDRNEAHPGGVQIEEMRNWEAKPGVATP